MQGKNRQPTERISPVGRPIWQDEKGVDYSEKTVTFPYKDKWVTFPSVDQNGNVLSEEEVEAYVLENGPVDPITGEVFPLFDSLEDATSFAQDRSKMLGGFNKGGLLDEDRQTQEAFDAMTGEAMALTPPRVEDQALVPRSQAGRGLDPVEFARPSFESALERFRSAGQVDVDPDDPALFNAYRRSLDYLGDMALGGLDLTDAAFRAAVGITAQALPENQERRFARDLAAMPDAFMGYSPGRIQAATDRVAEGAAQINRNLNQPGPMPTTGIFGGNLAADFGRQADGQRLPTSVGAEGLPRFEIDDSVARYNPQNLVEKDFSGRRLDTVDWDMVNAYPGRFLPTLDQVIDHPELFRQYPELAKVNIVIDTSLTQKVNGYYSPDKNLIAVSRDTADDPDLFAETLLHEVQHDVQKREGFDVGTSPESDIVGIKQASQIAQNPEAEEDIRYLGYYGKSGEVESRNVGDRKYLTLRGRFEIPPISTESVDRGRQWIVDESGNIKDAVDLFGTGEENRGGFLRRLGNLLRGRRGSQYNSGGVVSMEEQMSLFEMGGLADDGAMRDPVSGNEVPPGSLATEVRDDVPAMLSEGEYIVPADVVRYYGVKFFEDLRMGAKTGLSNMERDGRIGGEPVGATAEDDLTPEELQMLAEISGMYAGGDVRKPQKDTMSIEEVLSSNESIYDIINSPTTVYLGDGSIATSPEMKRDMFRRIGLIQIADASGMYGGGMVRRGYQEGGLNDTGFTPIPNYTIPGFSAFQPIQAPTVGEPKVEDKTVTLYGPNNEPVTLMLPRDQATYDSLLAQGYTTKPKSGVTTQTPGGGGSDSGAGVVTPTTTTTTTTGQDLGFTPLKTDEYKSLMEDPLKVGNQALEGKDFTRILGGLGSAILGPAGALAGAAFGAGITANNVAQARAASEIARTKGLDTTALDAKIEAYVSDLPNASRVASELFAEGDKMAERFFNTAMDMRLGAEYGPDGIGRDFFVEGPAGDAAYTRFMEENAPEGMVFDPTSSGYRREDGETGSSYGPTTSIRPVERPATRPDGTPTGSPESSSDRDSGGDRDTNVGNWGGDRDEDGVPNWRDFDDGVGWADTNRRATGGLVARPSRKKSVAKKK